MATASKEAETRLPDLTDGEMATVESIRVVEKTTRPPSHYTEGTLLDDMRAAGKFIQDDPELRKVLKESLGLGTAATRAATFEGLKHDQYIEKVGKYFKATQKGIAFIQWLETVAPDLTDVAVTARWEAELAVVAKTGGGKAFESRTASMVENLITRLKAAPALGLASTTTTTSKETSRMSDTPAERSGPTPKMLEYATNIASRMGTPLPDEAKTDFQACREFIDANKDAAMRPSEKQLKFATQISERKGVAIPADAQANGKLLSAWIDEHK